MTGVRNDAERITLHRANAHAALDRLVRRSHRHPAASFDFAHDGPSVAAITRQLRRRHATDSAYVGLACRLETTLWTLDGALARSANDVGLPVKLVA